MTDEYNFDDNDFKKQLTKLTDAFHVAYYDGAGCKDEPIWGDTYWMGVKVFKCPFDLWIYQEIVHDVRPEVIVETGVAAGGSILYLSFLCALMTGGEVLGIDIAISDYAKLLSQKIPKITLLEGSSTDPEIVKSAYEFVGGRNALVILDSDHAMDHVLQEMRLYNGLVRQGGYMIVEDSNVNGHPVRPEHGPGPYEAIEAFLKENNDFELDKSREKFYMTFNPNGYLRRIRQTG